MVFPSTCPEVRLHPYEVLEIGDLMGISKYNLKVGFPVISMEILETFSVEFVNRKGYDSSTISLMGTKWHFKGSFIISSNYERPAMLRPLFVLSES